jgi:hypothetical protein
MLGSAKVREAEQRLACPVEAACLVMSPNLERRGPWSGGPWSMLVLTSDRLLAFATRPAGWRHPNTSYLDDELMCVALDTIGRVERRFSINPLVTVLGLTLTDGQRMTLTLGRGSWNRHGDMVELITAPVPRPGVRRQHGRR